MKIAEVITRCYHQDDQPAPGQRSMHTDNDLNSFGRTVFSLIQSFLVCVGFCMVVNVLMAIILLIKDGDAPGLFPMMLGMGLVGSLFGSLFGCWLPVLLYSVTEKHKGAYYAGVATVAIIVGVISIPMAMDAYHSIG